MRMVLALAAALVLMPLAAAEPDPDATCVGGYNPNAITNVCYETTSGVPPQSGNTGHVEVGSERVCAIGQTCADVPVPGLAPGGGVPYTIPGRPGTPTRPYVEVLGMEVVPLVQEIGAYVDQVYECRNEPNPAINKVECMLGNVQIEPDPLDEIPECRPVSACLPPITL